MTVTLVLPWFPILLGVGVGARLLGPMRGWFLGVLCALFWTVLVQASMGPAVWSQPWTVAAIVAGAVAIAAMGAWSGQSAEAEERAARSWGRGVSSTGCGAVGSSTEGESWRSVAEVVRGFDEWLNEQGESADPWGAFNEFVRDALRRICGAGHVRPYRLCGEGAQLVPCGEADDRAGDGDQGERRDARAGIVGHVLATGRSYVAGDPGSGELVERIAAEEGERLAWCFAISEGTRRCGVVTVGHLGVHPLQQRDRLMAAEALISQFWRTLSESLMGRAGRHLDPVSRLPIRLAFFRDAERLIRESYQRGEPVVLAVFAVEGLRELNDGGRWEHADELIREVSAAMRRKVRGDDCLGRFDGSRFVLLLRRVDAELGSLIVGQLLSRLSALGADEIRWGEGIRIRCGVTGSGMNTPDLSTLLRRAMTHVHAARCASVNLHSDLSPAVAVEGTER